MRDIIISRGTSAYRRTRDRDYDAISRQDIYRMPALSECLTFQHARQLHAAGFQRFQLSAIFMRGLCRAGYLADT